LLVLCFFSFFLHVAFCFLKHTQVVMLGDTNTGKTSLVLRFAEGYYREESRSATVGAFFMTKRMQVNKLTCKIQIWDTAGQAQFKHIIPMYYKNAAAAIVCYDVSNRESFSTMRYWLDELHRNVAAGSIVICMCATKCDLQPPVIPYSEAQELAQAMGAMWVDTSAKTNFNVTELFRQVAERVLRFRENDKIPVTPGASIDEQGRVIKRGPTVPPSGTSSPLPPSYRQTADDGTDGDCSNEGMKNDNNSRHSSPVPIRNRAISSGSAQSSSAKRSKRRAKRRKSGNTATPSIQSVDSNDVQGKGTIMCEPMLCGALSSGGGDGSSGSASRGCVIL
jgi:small GTP-binding protein